MMFIQSEVTASFLYPFGGPRIIANALRDEDTSELEWNAKLAPQLV